jgi:hypothetical protein
MTRPGSGRRWTGRCRRRPTIERPSGSGIQVIKRSEKRASIGPAAAALLSAVVGLALVAQEVVCSTASSQQSSVIVETEHSATSETSTSSTSSTEAAPTATANNATTTDGGATIWNASASSGAPRAPLIADGESVKFPLYMRVIATLVCLIIFTVGVCGNLLVPLVVIKTKYLRNSTNLFLINLSIADLLVLIVCMPTVLIELHSRPETWLLGEAMCKYVVTRDLLRVKERANYLRATMSACRRHAAGPERGRL